MAAAGLQENSFRANTSLPKIEMASANFHNDHAEERKSFYERARSIQQPYEITKLKKSVLRSNDELIPSANKVDLTNRNISHKWPAKHPYFSHIPSHHLFPTYGDADPSSSEQMSALSFEVPSTAPLLRVVSKTYGSSQRREVLRLSKDFERKAMVSVTGPSYFKVLKSASSEPNCYYPTPTKLGNTPNCDRPVNLRVSARTSEAVRGLRQSHFVSTYQSDFSATSKLRRSNFEQQADLANQSQTYSKIDRAAHELDQGSRSEVTNRSISSSTTATVTSSQPSAVTPRSLQFKEPVEVREGNDPGRILLSGNASCNKYAQSQYATRGSSISHVPLSPAERFTSRSTQLEEAYEPCSSVSRTDDRSSGDVLNDMKHAWSKSEAHRKFHSTFLEESPDLRRKPDLRITTNERRHHIPEADNCGAFVFHGQSYPKKFEI